MESASILSPRDLVYIIVSVITLTTTILGALWLVFRRNNKIDELDNAHKARQIESDKRYDEIKKSLESATNARGILETKLHGEIELAKTEANRQIELSRLDLQKQMTEMKTHYMGESESVRQLVAGLMPELATLSREVGHLGGMLKVHIDHYNNNNK